MTKALLTPSIPAVSKAPAAPAYQSVNPSNGVLDDVSVVSAPEPSTMALSAVGGLFSLLALCRRK